MFKYIIYYSFIINPPVLASLESNLEIFARILSSCSLINRIDHQTITSWALDNLLVASIIKDFTKTYPLKYYFIISIDLINSSIVDVIIRNNPKEHT